MKGVSTQILKFYPCQPPQSYFCSHPSPSNKKKNNFVPTLKSNWFDF